LIIFFLTHGCQLNDYELNCEVFIKYKTGRNDDMMPEYEQESPPIHLSMICLTGKQKNSSLLSEPPYNWAQAPLTQNMRNLVNKEKKKHRTEPRRRLHRQWCHLCTSTSQSVDNTEFTAMPQKVTRIVTRFFERCPCFQGKTKNVNFTDLIFSATATTETVVNYFNRHRKSPKTKRRVFAFCPGHQEACGSPLPDVQHQEACRIIWHSAISWTSGNTPIGSCRNLKLHHP